MWCNPLKWKIITTEPVAQRDDLRGTGIIKAAPYKLSTKAFLRAACTLSEKAEGDLSFPRLKFPMVSTASASEGEPVSLDFSWCLGEKKRLPFGDGAGGAGSLSQGGEDADGCSMHTCPHGSASPAFSCFLNKEPRESCGPTYLHK